MRESRKVEPGGACIVLYSGPSGVEREGKRLQIVGVWESPDWNQDWNQHLRTSVLSMQYAVSM